MRRPGLNRYDFRPYDFGHAHPFRVIFDLWEKRFPVKYQTSWVERR
jgi:hypothetical protein